MHNIAVRGVLISALVALTCELVLGQGFPSPGPPPPVPNPLPAKIFVTRLGIPVFYSAIDSGYTIQAAAPYLLTYAIKNMDSCAGLSLTGVPPVAVTAQSNCVASVTLQPAATIAPSYSTVLAISVTGMTPGQGFSFSVSIGTNDTAWNPFTWTTAGEVVSTPVPEIEIRIDSAPAVNAAYSNAFRYTLLNKGCAPLALTGTQPVQTSGMSNCTASVSMPSTNPVPAGGSSTFTVSITGVNPSQGFSCYISVSNDDPDENPVIVIASGFVQVIDLFTADAPVVLGSPVSVAGGEFFEARVSIRNAGGVRCSAQYSLVISNDWALGQDDPVVFSGATSRLEFGQVESGTVRCQVPHGTPRGDYFLMLRGDVWGTTPAPEVRVQPDPETGLGCSACSGRHGFSAAGNTGLLLLALAGLECLLIARRRRAPARLRADQRAPACEASLRNARPWRA